MRPGDLKATAELSEAQKQSLSETADAFRGVHLDPNAHHWDEVCHRYLTIFIAVCAYLRTDGGGRQ